MYSKNDINIWKTYTLTNINIFTLSINKEWIIC